MEGLKFGRLLIITDNMSKELSKGGRYITCRCDCGTIVHIKRSNVISGNTSSCGCYQREKRKKHGLYNTSIYNIYRSLLQRCNNPNSKDYSNYGGRGIRHSEKWATVEGFIDDMCESYEEGLSLERIDVNGNYCKENCTWIPKNEQQKNTRYSYRIEIEGRILTLNDFVKKYSTTKYSIEKHGLENTLKLIKEGKIQKREV